MIERKLIVKTYQHTFLKDGLVCAFLNPKGNLGFSRTRHQSGFNLAQTSLHSWWRSLKAARNSWQFLSKKHQMLTSILEQNVPTIIVRFHYGCSYITARRLESTAANLRQNHEGSSIPLPATTIKSVGSRGRQWLPCHKLLSKWLTVPQAHLQTPCLFTITRVWPNMPGCCQQKRGTIHTLLFWLVLRRADLWRDDGRDPKILVCHDFEKPHLAT